MLVHKVYHRLSLLSLTPHTLPFKPVQFPSALSPASIRARPLNGTVRSLRTTAVMATSRLRNLVPVNAVASEDGSGGASNGSVASTAATTALEDEEDSTLGVRYRLPPQEIKDIVDAPPLPALSFSPHRDKILFLKRRSLPPLAELARPEEKLAGVRIDGKCNTRTRMSFYTGIGIHQLLPDGTLGPEIEVHGFPDGAKINFVTWSPDGRHLAFTIRFDEEESTSSKLKVWVAQVETGIARPLFKSDEIFLNAVFDNFVWVNDSSLLVCTIPLSRGDPPKKPWVPFGPKIQSNEQKSIIQVRTFQDLLKDEYDEDLFDYYATTQLVLASLDGTVKEIGPPAIYTSMDPSPDHKYLLISSIHRPYSFTVPCGRFPKKVDLWTADGKFVRELCDLPLAEDIPIAFNSVRRGMRSINWRADKPSTLYWVETQDEGDAKVDVSPRDIIYTQPAEPLEGEGATILHKLDLRYGGISWSDDSLALVYESWYKTRRTRTWVISPGSNDVSPRILFDRSFEDVYSDPGSPMLRRTPAGTYVLAKVKKENEEGTYILLNGNGATPEGNIPFLDLFDINTGNKERIWKSDKEKYYETVVALMSDEKEGDLPIDHLKILTSKESKTENTQYYILSWPEKKAFQITNFPHPYPQLASLQKEMVKYQPSSIFLLFSPTPKSFYHSLFISSSLSDNASISNHLYTLTRRPHVAGQEANAEAAAYVLSIFTSSSIKTHIAPYPVALTYPVSRSLTLTPSPQEPQSQINFNLQQEIYSGDPYADVAHEVLPTFHAFAKSGTVTAPVVYVNYGSLEDYEVLKQMGVNVSGSIVLARYGKIYRGSIVQTAYEAGAVGVLVYTDRKDYGGGGGEGKWFPDGKWLPPSGVQVGTVYNGLGDPTTPGWASSEEGERLSDDEVEKAGDVPLIPSLPVSAADGETILRAIGGQVANDDWQGSEDAPTYKVGPGPGIVHLSYTGKQVIGTIENVIGVIEGTEEPDRFVILGNHRDAWTFGAVDPNSGTAALLEIAQRLGKLQKRGWKPRRTIVLCNWDAEEYGLIGSTEWVEENRQMLASRAIAYLNVDSAVYGPGFWASATPQLDELLKQATQQVQDPDNSSQTIYQSWVGSSSSPTIDRLGSGESDFAAFVQHVGIPAADMAFGKGYPVYHSMYDDFIWMQKFGDPMFQRHVAVASLWGLVALWLADAEFLPFNYLSYALELQRYMKDLEDELPDKNINLAPLFKSIEELKKAAMKINSHREEIEQHKGWQFIGKNDHFKVRELNDRLMMAERAFTDQDGLLGRSWYKHLIYGPSKHDDYGSKSFPGIDEAIEKAKSLKTAESRKLVQHEVWRVARAVRHASQIINGELT